MAWIAIPTGSVICTATSPLEVSLGAYEILILVGNKGRRPNKTQVAWSASSNGFHLHLLCLPADFLVNQQQQEALSPSALNFDLDLDVLFIELMTRCIL